MEQAGVGFRVGHSPDAGYVLMFHALITGAVETPGRTYEHVLLDIQTLNEKALTKEYEISAVSIHSFPRIVDDYVLVSLGSAVGEG